MEHFIDQTQLDVAAFEALVQSTTNAEELPQAERIVSGIPLYRASHALDCLADPQRRRTLLDEWHHCLLDGPGVLAITEMMERTTVDRASESFLALIEAERGHGQQETVLLKQLTQETVQVVTK